MKRERVNELLRGLLEAASSAEWPTRLVESVYVFGSFARGAVEPGDVDVLVKYEPDERWVKESVALLMQGRSLEATLRRKLRGQSRSLDLHLFARDSTQLEDLTPLLIWERGEDLGVAHARIDAIELDPTSGKAERDAMLPAFEGLDKWIPRYIREAFVPFVEQQIITVESLTLGDGVPADPEAAEHVKWRWKEGSPLRRAGNAVLRYYEESGFDPRSVHLHGQDVVRGETPAYASFRWRYTRALPRCLTEHKGRQWIEILRPTAKQPLHALRIVPLDVKALASKEHDWRF